eukprot:scaffold2380_cov380-Prasinococcus_capsulatus_cf.AAC.5
MRHQQSSRMIPHSRSGGRQDAALLGGRTYPALLEHVGGASVHGPRGEEAAEGVQLHVLPVDGVRAAGHLVARLHDLLGIYTCQPGTRRTPPRAAPRRQSLQGAAWLRGRRAAGDGALLRTRRGSS